MTKQALDRAIYFRRLVAIHRERTKANPGFARLRVLFHRANAMALAHRETSAKFAP